MTNGEYIGAGSGITKLLLHFNNNSTDSSGNGNNGTDTAITYVDGKFGKCASFNGSSSKIDIPTISGITTVMTASCWIRSSDINSNRHILSLNGSSDNNNIVTSLNRTKAGKVDVITYDGSTALFFTSVKTVNDGIYHNVLYTRNGSAFKLYIDGKLDSSSTLSTFNIGLDRWGIGYNRNGKSAFYTGNADETIVEVGEWTPQQVAKYYSYAKGYYATL